MRNLSYSSSMVSAYYRCPQYFKYLYVDQLERTEGAPESSDQHFGTAVHCALNAVLEGDGGIGPFNAYWDAVIRKQVRYGRHDWETLKDMAEVLIARFERLHAKHYKPFSMEERLFGTLEDIRIEGTPDFIGEYDGVPSVVDFKTSSMRYDNDKIVFNEQMYLYQHLAKQSLGYNATQLVYVVLVKGKDPMIQVVKHTPSAQHVDQQLKNIVDVCHEIEARNTFIRNRDGCHKWGGRCDYWKKCYPENI